MNARSSQRWAAACTALIAASLFSSCVYYEESFGYGSVSSGHGYGSSYGSSYGYGSTIPVTRTYTSSRCHTCGHSPCRCRSGSHYGTGYGYSHRTSSHDHYREVCRSEPDIKRHHRPNAYQIVGGSTGSKKRPTGWHSVDWYKSRGYDVSKLTLRNEDGDVIRNGKRSSSSKKKKKS